MILHDKTFMKKEELEKLYLHKISKENEGLIKTDLARLCGCSSHWMAQIIPELIESGMIKQYIPKGRVWDMFILTEEGRKTGKHLNNVFKRAGEEL